MKGATHFVLETEHHYLFFTKKKPRYNRWNEKQVSLEIDNGYVYNWGTVSPCYSVWPTEPGCAC